mmetsp:Transcript_8631/g.24687  ORF Transcript_8631/g.24687 Transcript_8631/m.24687 type:complete len:81 (+) Transcript_8631:241-483(+)
MTFKGGKFTLHCTFPPWPKGRFHCIFQCFRHITVRMSSRDSSEFIFIVMALAGHMYLINLHTYRYATHIDTTQQRGDTRG